MSRDIMINAFTMSVPLFINFCCNGGIEALYNGNMLAILNLVAGATAWGIGVAVWFIYRDETKKQNTYSCKNKYYGA